MNNEMQNKGYKVIEGKGEYSHSFGGNSIETLSCPTCGLLVQTLFVFDLTDPIFKDIGQGQSKLPLASCLNCSGCWDTQYYEVESDRILNLQQFDEQKWLMEEEDSLPSPLPETPVRLLSLDKQEVLSSESSDEDMYDVFDQLGSNYIARIFGGRLSDGVETERITCMSCAKEMDYVASIGEDSTEGRLISVLPFLFGEMVLNFFYCCQCKLVRVEPIHS
ncbi:hypothetical protein [Planococcus dechangensis]|uniref:CbrC family protein n=1 Tax=Planococcus dechangensis TaxID=1176255 RepID=A0ABV9MAV8_9BACL